MRAQQLLPLHMYKNLGKEGKHLELYKVSKSLVDMVSFDSLLQDKHDLLSIDKHLEFQ